MIKFFEIISTGFYIGKLKKFGPTISTIIVIPFLLLNQKILIFIIILLLSIIGSYLMVKKTNKKDPQEVVIDEIVGFFLIFIFLDFNLKNFIIAFILFRIFDFLKPFPIKLLEDIKYFGIVLDDLMAGIYSVLTIKIITN